MCRNYVEVLKVFEKIAYNQLYEHLEKIKLLYPKQSGHPKPKTEDINCAGPQGSCLDLLLFLIYINYLPFWLKNSAVTMYPDNTTISYSSKNIAEPRAKLKNDLHCLK